MLKIILENEDGIYSATEKDLSEATLTQVRMVFNGVLRSAGYVFDEEDE